MTDDRCQSWRLEPRPPDMGATVGTLANDTPEQNPRHSIDP